MDELPAAVASLRERLEQAAVFVDFDGSLAPIVARPADARPLPEAVAALTALSGRCRTVAVVSGRPVAFLARWFLPAVWLAGLYGLEQRVDGTFTREADALRWEQVVAAALQEDADVIGLSILSGAHNHIAPRLMELLKAKGLDDVLVLLGGIIPDVDVPRMKEIGVKGIFLPGTPMQEIIDFINANVRERVS